MRARRLALLAAAACASACVGKQEPVGSEAAHDAEPGEQPLDDADVDAQRFDGSREPLDGGAMSDSEGEGSDATDVASDEAGLACCGEPSDGDACVPDACPDDGGNDADASPAAPDVCGDGMRTGAEECDEPDKDNGGDCLVSCLWNPTRDTASECGAYPTTHGSQVRVTPRPPVMPGPWSFADPIDQMILRAEAAPYFMGGGEPTQALVRRRTLSRGADIALVSQGFTEGGIAWRRFDAASSEAPQVFGYTSKFGYTFRGFDFNADGLEDHLYGQLDRPYASHTGRLHGAFLSDATREPENESIAGEGVPLSVALDPSWPLKAADLNGDRRTDVYVLYDGVCGLSLLSMLSNGDGTFTSLQKTRIDATQGLADATLHDVTGDGRDDILAWRGRTLLVSTNEESGWSKMVETNLPEDVDRASYSDLDGDARTDLFVVRFPGNGTVELGVALALGDGSFAPFSYWRSAPMPFQAGLAHLMDLNGDGRSDLLVSRGQDAVLAAGRGDGSFDPWYELPDLQYPDANLSNLNVAPADLNNDGKTDLFRGAAYPYASSGPPWAWQILLGR